MDRALTFGVNTAHDWADRIEKLGRSTLPDAASVRAAGTGGQGRRVTSGLLYACLTGEPPQLKPAVISADDDRLLASAAGLRDAGPPPKATGPMQPRSRDDVIELWTERELTMVHAAWLVEGWSDVALASARWLIDEIQPDNATNLPWAVHVFASMWAEEESHEARMYAETLLHNCVVARGTPDPLSALILLDAARQLRVRYTG